MLIYPQFNPIALSLGPIHLRWYGIMYLFSFLIGWGLARYRVKRQPWSNLGWSKNLVDDIITWAILGVILGGRLGYVFFYDFSAFMADPLEIFRIWHGGMSFHGGFVGVLIAMFLWKRKQNMAFFDVMDFIAPFVPPGLFFGRIGNFINGELWGKTTSSSFGMIFPYAGSEARHPSQLYEAALEGILLFIILWIYSSSKRVRGRVSGLFALCYGIFRFLVEFVRQPDAHLGYIAFGWLTMGQLLCIPLLIVGLFLLYRKER